MLRRKWTFKSPCWERCRIEPCFWARLETFGSPGNIQEFQSFWSVLSSSETVFNTRTCFWRSLESKSSSTQLLGSLLASLFEVNAKLEKSCTSRVGKQTLLYFLKKAGLAPRNFAVNNALLTGKRVFKVVSWVFGCELCEPQKKTNPEFES